MKNILIFASISAIASAIAIYFVTENNRKFDKPRYVTDNEMEAYDYIENTGRPTIVE